MDEKQGSHKPLRATSNKLRDLYATYIKNEENNSKPDEKAHGHQGDNAESQYDADASIENGVADVPVETEMVLQLVDKFDKITRERDELKEQFKRMAAELENFRRRSMREKQEMIDYANERLLYKLLPLIDDLTSAVDASKQSADLDALTKGIAMISAKTQKLFEEAGVVRMENPVGKPFNVDLQEAMMHIPSELPEEYVVQEILPGYMIGSKVLRHAKVVTSAGMPELDFVSE